jgi:hypothetical protein
LPDSSPGAPLPAVGSVVELHWLIDETLHSATARIAASRGAALRVLLKDGDAASTLPMAPRVVVLYEVAGMPFQTRAKPREVDGFWELEIIRPPAARDRREFVRLQTVLPVLALPASSLTPARGLTPVPFGESAEVRVTLSGSGMVFPVFFTTSVGLHLDMLLTLPDGHGPLAIQGEVVGERKGGVAVKFTSLGAHDEARLVEWVHRKYLEKLATD